MTVFGVGGRFFAHPTYSSWPPEISIHKDLEEARFSSDGGKAA
jgi:hypothetical protein